MNPWRLSFSDGFDYSHFSDILFPVTISAGLDKQVLVRAKLETGSTFCVLQRRYADLLGLETEHGTKQRIQTATGSLATYGHEVTIRVGQFEWQAVIYLAEYEGFPVNVVGRVGFLDRLRVGLVDYEQLLYLNAYDET